MAKSIAKYSALLQKKLVGGLPLFNVEVFGQSIYGWHDADHGNYKYDSFDYNYDTYDMIIMMTMITKMTGGTPEVRSGKS